MKPGSKKDLPQQERTRTSDILAGIVDTFYSLDESWRFTVVNPAAEKAPFGRKASELLGMVIWDLYPALLGTEIHGHYLTAAKKRTLEHYEAQSPLNSRWYEVFMQGWQRGVDVYMRDITERKKTEEALRKSQSQLSHALIMGKMGHWELDVATGMFTFSDDFYAIFKTSAAELGGYTMSLHDYARRFVHPDDAFRVGEETCKALEAETPDFKRYVEHRMLYADGSVGHIAVRFFIMKDNQGRTVKTYGVNQDITEKKRMEEELQKSQKLESLGLLAGGIAHDFNNLLGAIFGYIELAAESKKEELVLKYLAKALGAIDRARGLTRQLLTFAKGGAPIKTLDRLIPFIEETAKFALSGSSVSPCFAIRDDLWLCEFDKNQIGQVIDNIVINAQQAMPEGGTLKITADNVELSDEHATLPEGKYVKIAIQDQGIGMPKEILPKIFDPFFTTKAKGHGLGLATCYSIINRHGGCIEVESEPGKGSTFTLFLPAAAGLVQNGENRYKSKHSGSGIFLVMDDEELMREIIGAMLESFGYTVILKENGKDVMDFIKLEKKNIAAMIFDLTIPGGMGGKEVIGEIRKVCSELPVFVASGYAEDPVMAQPANYGFTASICKPFTKAQLAEMLNSFIPKKS